ncbi:MAG: DUF411 domain-containing protein [Gemmatimonadetes bacterium]|nr:DUF411 domain-containing protein [Gemmatimonadota bacterium]
MRVYKTPTCGCCSGWIDHLREHGYEVATEDMDDLTPVKVAQGVPARLQTCHTATVAGYVIEGHVPADVIQRLLEERPDLVGLAVPGMPIGSPGMEVPGQRGDPYEVIGFRRDGSTVVYARR